MTKNIDLPKANIPRYLQIFLLVFPAGIAISYLYFRVAPLQVDPSHDGLMLSAAIGVSEGREVLSGVFSQYGPLPPLINGFIVSVFGTQLLTLRYFAAAQILITGILIYFLGKKVATSQFSAIITAFWLLCSAIWSTAFPGALLAWPSMTATILTMLGLHFLTLNPNNGNGISLNPILAGIFLALAGFCRIQAFAIVPILAIIMFLRFRERKETIVNCFLGYFGGILVFILYMIKNQILDDFVNQVVLTPLFSYSGVGSDQNHNIFQLPMYLIKAFAFLSILFLTSLASSKIRSRWKIYPIIGVLVATLILSGNFILSLKLPIRVRVLLGEAWSDFLLTPYYFSVVVTTVIFFALVLGKTKTLNFHQTAYITVATVLVLQLYPQPDVMHLWWIAPVLILAVPIAISYVKQEIKPKSQKSIDLTKAIRVKTISIVLVVLSFGGAVQGVLFVNKSWSEYSLPVLEGTYAETRKVQNQRIFDVIPNFAKPGLSSFDCLEGIYSVSEGVYLAQDQWFVNWGNNEKERQALGDVRFICDKPKSYANTFAKRNGFKLIYFKVNSNSNSIAILKKVDTSE
jgi:hypothetical protein